MGYASQTLTDSYADGKMGMVVPTGFERLVPALDPDGSGDFIPMRLLSGVAVTRGDLLQYSGGYAVSADSSALQYDMAGICVETVSGSSVNTEITMDMGIMRGVIYKVQASDAAMTSTDIGGYCNVTTSGKVLFSGSKNSTAQFQCVDVLNYTNKIVAVRLNRHSE